MELENEFSIIISEVETINKCYLLKTASDAKGKDVYLRNTIAKTISMLKSIDLLYKVENYNDGWILYRSLIDRLVYIYYLIENDNFKDFDEWTYVELFEYRHNAKVDERYRRLQKDPKFKTQNGETNTYNEYKKRLNWRKPKPKDVLKLIDLEFIYKYGYDYASRHTHPMSYDGSKEFYHLTGLIPNPHDFNEDSLLLKNSLIISSMIFNVIIQNLNIERPRYYLDFMSEFRKFAFGLEKNYKSKFKETFESFKKDSGC
jgi:hypothetical protein